MTPAGRGRVGRHRHRRRRPRSRVALAAGLAALATASAVSGVLLLRAGGPARGADVGALPAVTGPPTASPTAAPPRADAASPTPHASSRPPAGRPPPAATSMAPAAAAPVTLAIPRAGLTAPVVPIGVRAGGDLDLPRSPRTVGWWVGSAPAGDRRDATLIAGHVDSTEDGIGVLAALRDLRVGDAVRLVDVFGADHGYRVAARRTYPKYALPRDLFQIAGRRQLLLVTCGGPYDERTRRYRDNVVVYAVPH